MAVPCPPPAFLLASQAPDPWLAHRGRQGHDVAPTKQLAAGEDSEAAVSDFGSAPFGAGSRPAIYAVTARAEDSGGWNAAAGGVRSLAAVDPDKAATERGGPVYLEQPDGSVQLKLLRNPLYRPPVDEEDSAAERDVPLYRAVLDDTYQARLTPRICCLVGARFWCCRRCYVCHFAL